MATPRSPALRRRHTLEPPTPTNFATASQVEAYKPLTLQHFHIGAAQVSRNILAHIELQEYDKAVMLLNHVIFTQIVIFLAL